MQRVNGENKKFIAFILIVVLSFLCICSHGDHVYRYGSAHSGDVQASDVSADSSLSGDGIKKQDIGRIVEENIVSNVKTSEQLTRGRQNVRGAEEIMDFVGIYSLLQTKSMSAYIPILIAKGEQTPRYVVIVYLHLSDGKKSQIISKTEGLV